jgi:hypothetical protein
MPVPLISLQATLGELLDENSFTLGELQSHPLASSYTAQFDAFQDRWLVTSAARTALVIALGKAGGALYAADDALDDFVDLLDRTLLIITKNDRAAALYRFYFGLRTPNELKRPILGEELLTVRGFASSLESSPHAALATLAPTLAALIIRADAVVAEHQAAEQALKDMDRLGAVKALIDEYNALRQTVYGKLAALPHESPAAMLPATFADRFFRHESHKGIQALRNPKDVQAKVDGYKKKMEAAQRHLDGLKAAAEQKALDRKAAQEAEAALEQGRKDKKAADQKVKDLERQAKAAKQKSKGL